MKKISYMLDDQTEEKNTSSNTKPNDCAGYNDRAEHQLDYKPASVRLAPGKYYESLCFRCDKGLLLFLVQVAFGATVITFSIAQLARGVSADERTVYVGLIASIIAWFLPAPHPGPTSEAQS